MKTYNTIQGDMWDSISYRVYGSELYTTELFTANPDYQNIAIFGANITLNVPEIETAINITLPPWLRKSENDTTLTNTELLNLLNNHDTGYPHLLSYRFIDRYTARMIAATKKGFE